MKLKMTREMVQERVNELYGGKPFRIKKWDGAKKPVCISYGKENPVNIMIDRGEYLYRKDMKKHVLDRIFNQVQVHLDQQGKEMTLIHISGEDRTSIAMCQCCGAVLKYEKGSDITSKTNVCSKCSEYEDAIEKWIVNDMAITGIHKRNLEQALDYLLERLQSEQDVLKLKINSHQEKVNHIEKELFLDKKFVEEEGIHQYFINEYFFWMDDEERECA